MDTQSDLPSPEAIFFDADGTLLDSADFLLSGHNHVRDSYGQPRFSSEDFHNMISMTTKDVYARLYGDRSEAAQKILYTYINERQSDHLKPIEGARETLEFLSGQGIPLGIVSNKNQASLESAVEKLGWQGYFRTLVGAGGPRRGKPSAEPLLYAMENIKLPLDRVGSVWMVGDHGADIGCARAAGGIGILVHYHWDPDSILKTCEPHLVIPRLGALRDVLLEISRCRVAPAPSCP